MDLISPRLGDDNHLTTRPFSVFSAVGVAQYVEFANRVDAQQLLARPARLHIILGRTGILDPIQQKKILLRPISGYRKIVTGGRIGYSDPTGLFRGEVNNARIQSKQQIVTAPIEGQIFHLLLTDQPGNVLSSDAHDCRVPSHFHLFADRPDSADSDRPPHLAQPRGEFPSGLLPQSRPS